MNPDDIYLDSEGEAAINPQTGEPMTVAEFQATQTKIDPEEFQRQEAARTRAEEFNNTSWPTKIGRFAVSMAAPVSAAYAEHKALQGEERAALPTIGAAAADVGLSLLLPLRLGMAGLRAAGVALPRFATGNMVKASSNRLAQAGIGAADNVANSVMTTGAENIAGDRDNDYFGAMETGLPAAIGGVVGGRKYKRMTRAEGEQAASYPKNIRLNEQAGTIAELETGAGSTKNDEMINLGHEIFKNPNKPLSDAISETKIRKNLLKQSRPDVKNFNPHIIMSAKFEHPARNTHDDYNKALNATRNWLLDDMYNKGHITSEGVPINKIDEVNEYLNNLINWNKNRQGINRSADDELAAREIFSEIRQGIENGKVIDADGIMNSEELAALDKWKKDYYRTLVELDVLTGIKDKRSSRYFVKQGGDYFPTRDLDIADVRNVDLHKELAPNLASARFREEDLSQERKPDYSVWPERIGKAANPVEQYLSLADKHGKDFGPAREFYRTLTKEQQMEAMERLLTGE